MEILGDVVTAFPECLWPPPLAHRSWWLGNDFFAFLLSWCDVERRTHGRLGRASALMSGYLAEILKMVIGGVMGSWRLPPHHHFPVLSFVVRVSIRSSGGADQRG